MGDGTRGAPPEKRICWPVQERFEGLLTAGSESDAPLPGFGYGTSLSAGPYGVSQEDGKVVTHSQHMGM